MRKADTLKETGTRVENIKIMMDEVLNDRGIPRNIRTAVENAKNKVASPNAGPTEFSAAIYDLDDVSNDINMPMHARTTIWEIISELERVKETVKK